MKMMSSRKKLHGPNHHQHSGQYKHYILFGKTSVFCLILFLFLYLVFLLCFLPMINYELTEEDIAIANDHSKGHKRFQNALKGVKRLRVLHRKDLVKAIEQEKLLVHHVGEIMNEEGIAFRHKIQELGIAKGPAEEKIFEKQLTELENKIRDAAKGHDAGGNIGNGGTKVDAKMNANADAQVNAAANFEEVRPQNDAEIKTPPKITKEKGGFIVLGMHRSGTSMLSGLLVTGMGYNVGSPLIGAAFDNEKGFFELLPAVLQNDEFMNTQGVWWSSNVLNYDHKKALQKKKDGLVTFQRGQKALTFFNNEDNYPWLQKDPRMCITLRTWLPLFKDEPAVVFTYRHPLEVAMSLKKRERGFTLGTGLKLWIDYNMRAVQNSSDLCRVFSSNDAILADPKKEVQRISDELTSKCGLMQAPQRLSDNVVNQFVDTKLQHNKEILEQKDKDKRVLEKHGDCIVKEFDSDFNADSVHYKTEMKLYLTAMKIYCDLQSGVAYRDDYKWPNA